MDLTGKTAMIIGAGRGIGRATAEMLVRDGANVVLAARSESEILELEYELTSKYNADVLTLATDAANAADVKILVDEAVAKFGAIDILIFAAGKGILKPFAELTLADLDELLTANTRSAFVTLQAVLPVMEKQKSGRVIVIPGILGRAPMASAAAYSAAKYALTGMIKCLALEYKRAGVKFSLMHFGGVDSSFWDDITMRVQRDKMLSIADAANAVYFAATQTGDGVLGELILQPESHQM